MKSILDLMAEATGPVKAGRFLLWGVLQSLDFHFAEHEVRDWTSEQAQEAAEWVWYVRLKMDRNAKPPPAFLVELRVQRDAFFNVDRARFDVIEKGPDETQ